MEIVAHRGNSKYYPQNTILSFESAISLGVEWIEVDVHKTKDGQLVVIHDDNTEYVGNRNLIIKDVSYNELKQVDVATYMRKQAKNTTLEFCSIPLLADIFRLIRLQSQTKISIQPKADITIEVLELIVEMDMTKLVGFNDGDLQKLLLVKEFDPSIPIYWDRGYDDIDKDIKIALKHGFNGLVVQKDGITKEIVQKIKKARLTPGVWTVNDSLEMKSFISMAVERFYTDAPEELKRISNTMP